MTIRLLPLLAMLVLYSCQEITDVTLPNTKWDRFEASGNIPVGRDSHASLEGIYSVSKEAADFYGPLAAAKWSYTLTGKDTTWHLSVFFEDEAGMMILEGRKAGNSLLLNGYWRKMVNTENGKVRFVIDGVQDSATVLTGNWGDGDDEPKNPVVLTRTKSLQPKKPLTIIAHRGGGRNNDLLPASENSLQMIKLAARLGASGVEIDVKLSKDGVPVLYHDEKINDRLTEKAGIRGDIVDYSYAELSKIELKRGGSIPTLEQALDTLLYKTPLEFVWLDCKYDGNLQLVRALQQTYAAKAKSAGRNLTILIGIPDENTQKNFVRLPQYKSIPSLTELDTAMAISMQTSAWAPSWTKGLQTEAVAGMHRNGKRVYVWTVDKHDKIEEFIREGSFDGIVSNRPEWLRIITIRNKGNYSFC